MANVEDEDNEFMREINNDSVTSPTPLPEQNRGDNADWPTQRSITGSLQSQASYSSLPKATHLHRPNYSRHQYSGSISPGRQRALSDAHLRTRKKSHETISMHPSPIGTHPNQPNASALSSSTPSDVGQIVVPDKRAISRLTLLSRLSSRDNLT